ncbi:MAG: hypothetical protein FWC23_03350 [Chitinispirillia bacterium]|nr:hypothetical protein [Chitinispirillia bacterium]MCL2268212.1 hypothetical protein [Chitinispirillia bacterium]
MPRIINAAILFSVLALGFAGCGHKESARIEIDFSNAADWRYQLAVAIDGTPQDSAEFFSGSLRAYLKGLPGEQSSGPLRAGLTDVHLIAPFMPEAERGEVERRLAALEISVSESGVTLSDTNGLPGVLSGGWDIMRSPARVIPAMPNAEMVVGASWEREQRFPIAVPQGEADGLLYQLYTLDSLYKTNAGIPVAAISWEFSYRVAVSDDTSGSREQHLRHPLQGSGRGFAELDLQRKMLLRSQATFQVTHSNASGRNINEVVHFEMVE